MLTTAPRIETERLILRGHRLEDFQRFVDLYASERSRYIGGPLPANRVWQGFMNAVGHWPILGFGSWAIDLRSTGEFIGQVAVSKPVEYPEHELGWLLFEGHDGFGYGFEAARRVQRFALDDLGVPSLVSYVDPGNARSIKLALRLGGVRDAGAPTPNGDPTLVYRYAANRRA